MNKIDGLVVFAILMENNNGILGKVPDYVLEKYEICTHLSHPERFLDSGNLQIFEEYMNTWFRPEE